MTFTKEQITSYLIDVKGYNKDMVFEIFAQMTDFGVGIEEYLSQEELSGCYEFNN